MPFGSPQNAGDKKTFSTASAGPFEIAAADFQDMTFEALTEATPLTPEQEATVRAVALQRAPAALARIENIVSDSEAFAHLPGAAAAAFHLGQFSRARELATLALSLARVNSDNWNYGNAIHVGHTILGLLALEQDDVASAIEELRRSGDTPGSPQLNSFGPTMQLAKELLRRGQTEAVLLYLEQCRRFWQSGSVWFDLWEPKVRAGQVPNCFQHSYV